MSPCAGRGYISTSGEITKQMTGGRRLLTAGLLVFAALTLGVAVRDEMCRQDGAARSASTATPPAASKESPPAGEARGTKLIVYFPPERDEGGFPQRLQMERHLRLPRVESLREIADAHLPPRSLPTCSCSPIRLALRDRELERQVLEEERQVEVLHEDAGKRGHRHGREIQDRANAGSQPSAARAESRPRPESRGFRFRSPAPSRSPRAPERREWARPCASARRPSGRPRRRARPPGSPPR